MWPEWMDTPVNGFAAAERSEPAIGIGRQRIGVHDEGARRCRLPVRDNIGGTPGRRRFHEVGGLCIEETMDPRRIVEKAIAPVDDQGRDRKSTRLNSSPSCATPMPSSASTKKTV